MHWLLLLSCFLSTFDWSACRGPVIELTGETTVILYPQAADVYRLTPGPMGRRVHADLSNPVDQRRAQELIRALSAAEPADPKGANSPDIRARVGGLYVRTAEGESMEVRPALHCVSLGNQTKCSRVQGKQVVSDETGSRVVASPELERFLNDEVWPRLRPPRAEPSLAGEILRHMRPGPAGRRFPIRDWKGEFHNRLK